MEIQNLTIGVFLRFDWDKIDDFFKPEAEMTDEANIHLYLQFHAHKQLLDASNYAKQRVILKAIFLSALVQIV